MKDILRPILELLVVLPGLLLGYFPVKTYLKQSPGRLAVWPFPLMACLCIGSGLACYRLHASTVQNTYHVCAKLSSSTIARTACVAG